MPTKREIAFNFMGLMLTDVVQDLNAEWELRILSRLLATVLNQKKTFRQLVARTSTAVLLRGMITACSFALDMLQDRTDTMIFDDMKRILHENRELLMSSDRSMRIVLFSKARQRISSQSQCRTRCWRYCHLCMTQHHFRILASNSRT